MSQKCVILHAGARKATEVSAPQPSGEPGSVNPQEYRFVFRVPAPSIIYFLHLHRRRRPAHTSFLFNILSPLQRIVTWG